MIKLIASDLDGTLLHNGAQKLTPRAIELIHELTQKGIHFVAASGRQYDNERRLFSEIKDEISYIGENGSICIHQGKVISRGIIADDLACRIIDEVKKAIADGAKPEEIINDQLIAAINKVGEFFEQKKYFLPQLIASANTMKLAIDYLEPMLEKKNDGQEMPTLVIATVEGDIHDIGKNLVVLMLKNYGYNVIDMGKDVPCEDIVDTAIRENAAIIGLSALMTTTMMRMQDVVELCKEKGCKSKVIIGGACITQSFADEIGADGYSKDAAECVRLVERLLA